jgi:outer membrane protein insertion porin family
MNVPAAKTIKTLYLLFVIAAFTSLFTSCVTDYPKKPFVYNYNIDIKSNDKYTAEEVKVLHDQLEQQLHDSIRVRRERKFLFLKVLKKPPVFDSVNMSTSQRYMRTMLHTLGYLRDSINSSYKIDTVEDQYRTLVNFNVFPGRLFRMDSIWYNLLDSVPYTPEIDTLQKLTVNSLNQTVVRKGDPFSQYLISSELDRIADLARNNGYLKFGKEQLLAVWDTVGRSILTATTDITEQLRQLEELRRRRENPTADLEIRLRGNLDTSRLTRYYVGDVRIYPDTDIDTANNDPATKRVDILTPDQYHFISYRNLFKPRKLTNFIYLHRGDLYSQTNVQKTQRRFSDRPAWRIVNVIPEPRPGTDTVDFNIQLIPAKQFRTDWGFDISKNIGNLAYESGGLVGLGANLTLINRNFAKAANLLSTNFRYGIELGSRVNTIQSQQFSVSNNIQFPRLVPKLRWLPIPQEQKDRANTLLSYNLSYTDRIDYFKVFSLRTAWTYEFSWNKTALSISIPNIDYNFLERRDSLKKLIENNQSYRYIFNDGLILSSIVNVTTTGGKGYVTNLFRFSGEEAGLVTSPIIKAISPDAKAYRFVKLDAEFSQNRKLWAKKRSALALRGFVGVGYGLPFSKEDGTKDSTNLWLPFFRQYYAGGPNSMRAWSLRKLGPGSSVKSFARTVAPDRFGDVRLELNAELRIYLAQFLGAYPMETVLFTDIGNVWFLRENKDFPNGEFRFNRLAKDIAIGVGTGLRIDFGFLMARFDFAWKAKDPSPAEPAAQNKWFYNWRPWIGNKTTGDGVNAVTKYGAQFQLGINYPF